MVATEQELAKHEKLAEDKAKEADQAKTAGAEQITALQATHAQVMRTNSNVWPRELANLQPRFHPLWTLVVGG